MTQFAAMDPALMAVAMAIAAATGLLRAWITHRTTVRTEEEQTRRIRFAVAGSAPAHRAAVVRACAELTAASRALSKPSRVRSP
jgi:protein involved in polysaccharide export with SLBB domain